MGLNILFSRISINSGWECICYDLIINEDWYCSI